MEVGRKRRGRDDGGREGRKEGERGRIEGVREGRREGEKGM